jgi:glutamine amidotransferase
MQLMCKHSEESDTECLGIFDLEVKEFIPENDEKVPHMGWNNIEPVTDFTLFRGMEDLHAYFVHSFYVPMNEWNIATANYIQPFSAAIHRDNFYAVQFHPEKSGPQGQKILQNFIEQ